MIFRRFPYTTLNDINLDWIIKQVKQIAAALQGKQDKPEAAGEAGQVLGLDDNLDPVWLDNGGGGGTTNYNSLTNKPQINGVTLSGNKTTADLGITIPTGSLALPLMDGTASAGSNLSRFALEGHVHPTDTTRASMGDLYTVAQSAGTAQTTANQNRAMIAIVANGNTAPQNIAQGQYVIWNGALYTASAAIASGATLSSSNLTAVSGGGLNALLAEQGTIKNPFEISANTDLNNLLGVGVYYSPLGSLSTTLLNYPGSSVAFSMMCLKALGGSVSLQIIITDEKIFVRRYGLGVWNPWYTYTGTINSTNTGGNENE